VKINSINDVIFFKGEAMKSISLNKAFTLVELLITVGLIVVLLSVMIPAVTAIQKNGKETMAKTVYSALSKAVKDES